MLRTITKSTTSKKITIPCHTGIINNIPLLKSCRNNQTLQNKLGISEKKNNQRFVNILVTGAAGQIGYSLVPLLYNKLILKPFSRVNLVLNDLPECENILKGIKMELEDCALTNYLRCKVVCDPEEAYRNADYVIMLANMMQLTPETTRFELLKENKRLYTELAKIIDSTAKPTTKFIMVANPANSNCLLLMDSIKTIPAKNFSCLTFLDYNRTCSAVARLLGVSTSRLRKVIVWGNHSSTMYPDLTHAEVFHLKDKWVKLTDIITDKKWLYEYLPEFVQTRFTAIIEARKKSSALSAAHATMCHLQFLDRGIAFGHDDDWRCLGVRSIGQYGLPENIVFGTPCRLVDQEYKIIENLEIDPFIREKMQISADELVNERNSIM